MQEADGKPRLCYHSILKNAVSWGHRVRILEKPCWGMEYTEEALVLFINTFQEEEGKGLWFYITSGKAT